MKFFRRFCGILCTLLAMNIVLWYDIIGKKYSFFVSSFLACFSLTVILFLLFLLYEILPCYEKGLTLRLQLLAGGYELIITSAWCLFLEIAAYLLYFCICRPVVHRMSFFSVAAINGLVAYLVLLFHYLNGFWRTAVFSSQLGIRLRLFMLFFWWLPPVNLFLFFQWCAIVHRELLYEKNRYLLDTARIENTICRTRYPVMMVHGIFFRDWQYLNYWGRIPQALKRNGASVYYGRQQSSLSVADSASELKKEIFRILEETGAPKVNIIAHSKGGLDARYAISCLGMADYVASLTTVSTPHRGCQFADALLMKLPNALICFAAKRYNSLFHRLGDSAPDFLSGVQNLTAAFCAVFNTTTPDMPEVYYQSVASRMHSAKSAPFPLSLGYRLCKKYEGDNDGLVSVSSAVWGNYLGLLTAGRKGISHGDMIDLTHKNIKGFDVNEFYVQLFAGLQKKGF